MTIEHGPNSVPMGASRRRFNFDAFYKLIEDAPLTPVKEVVAEDHLMAEQGREIDKLGRSAIVATEFPTETA